MFNIHGGIDDATSNVTGLFMTKNECMHGYFEVMRQTIEQNGIPASVYADRHTIFQSPNAGKLTIEDQLEGKEAADTQFGRAMRELGINLIAAQSPQAKGRIERLWDTLQSRLPVEFRIHGIKTIDEANAFLLGYIPQLNELIAVEPGKIEKAYIPTTLNLDLVLCVKEKRTADNGGVFSFHGKSFKIVDYKEPGKVKVEVVASAARGIFALYNGEELDVVPHIKPKKATAPSGAEQKPASAHNRNRPIWDPKAYRYSSDLSDSEICKMLEEIFLSKYA